MIACTAIWCGESQRALDIAIESIEAARRVGYDRAEILARTTAGLFYQMRGELGLARQHTEGSIALSRRLGARRFEAECLCDLGHLDFLEGRGTEALEKVRASVAIIREVGMAFLGPAILGMLVLVTDDEAERRAAGAEAETLLAAGSISHNHLYFRRDAIDASLRAGEYDEAERHSNLLAGFCPEEGLPLIVFLADRGRALARVGRGERSDELAAEVERLIVEGERMLQTIAVADLRRARAALLD